MLEKPSLPDAVILACLENEYGLLDAQLEFLPLGADANTAVYRASTGGEGAHFVKLRRGAFDQTSVDLPRYLSEQGARFAISPLPNRAGGLWSGLGEFKLVLYPFVEGQDAYQIEMSDRLWADFGAAIRQLHSTQLPPAMENCIPREEWSPHWREMLAGFMRAIKGEPLNDPDAKELAAILRAQRQVIQDLIERAGSLAHRLKSSAGPYVLCHSDLHAGNLHITPQGSLFIVDWDSPILAPKERDLMYAGGGQFGGWRSPQEEEKLFYQGYGEGQIDAYALAYYRYERIVEDLAAFCQQIFQTEAGGPDRQQALIYVKSNFLPGNTLEIANRSDPERL